MKNKNFCIPNGIEYYMPKKALGFEKLKVSALKIFKKYKYDYVVPPIFDNLDNLLNLKSSDVDNETITFLDKLSSSEIGIRADITPQIAKIDFQITQGKSDTRFAYMGDIFRLSSNLFDRKNPYQIGAEHFGNVSTSTDIEIIKLMLEIISLSGEKKIEYGHPWAKGTAFAGDASTARTGQSAAPSGRAHAATSVSSESSTPVC